MGPESTIAGRCGLTITRRWPVLAVWASESGAENASGTLMKNGPMNGGRSISPLAGIAKCVFKLLLVAYLATFLEYVPMACIGGIMIYVAYNMVKPAEISLVLSHGRIETLIMAYTAVMVLVTNFVTGVGTAIVLYALASRFPQFIPPKARQ